MGGYDIISIDDPITSSDIENIRNIFLKSPDLQIGMRLEIFRAIAKRSDSKVFESFILKCDPMIREIDMLGKLLDLTMVQSFLNLKSNTVYSKEMQSKFMRLIEYFTENKLPNFFHTLAQAATRVARDSEISGENYESMIEMFGRLEAHYKEANPQISKMFTLLIPKTPPDSPTLPNLPEMKAVDLPSAATVALSSESGRGAGLPLLASIPAKNPVEEKSSSVVNPLSTITPENTEETPFEIDDQMLEMFIRAESASAETFSSLFSVLPKSSTVQKTPGNMTGYNSQAFFETLSNSPMINPPPLPLTPGEVQTSVIPQQIASRNP